MASKYHSGVPYPKGIKIVNQSAKMTPRQTKFAKGLVGAVKKLEGMKK